MAAIRDSRGRFIKGTGDQKVDSWLEKVQASVPAKTSTKKVDVKVPSNSRADQSRQPGETKSAWIRRLNLKEGLAVRDIARVTGIKYQMVRNVCVAIYK